MNLGLTEPLIEVSTRKVWQTNKADNLALKCVLTSTKILDPGSHKTLSASKAYYRDVSTFLERDGATGA
jgi:hypothetical protein